MKKQLVFIIILSLLFSFHSLAFASLPPALPSQQVCQWHKVQETPNTMVSGTALDATASLNGSSVTVSWQGLITVHSWTAPGVVLTPGDELYFEVNTAWELDRNSDLNSVGGLNTYINLNFMQTVEARQKSINFSTEPSGSIGNSTTWTVPAGNQPGATMEIIGFADAAVAGGSVRYLYEYRCVDPTPMDTETPLPSETPQSTAVITPTPAQCEPLTEDEKLEKILDLYYAKIPKGITSSGTSNNIRDFLGFKGYDEFACGGYQSKVLNFLNSLKFSKDPCEQALLEKWDYGPIQAWWGGHQAVVIYPWATNWMETGLVLDPWITQFPATYKVKDWAIYFSVAGMAGEPGRIVDWTIDGSFIGIGPSEVYRGAGAYPVFGGDYVEPGLQGLTKEELEFLKTLPQEKQDLFKKMSKAQQKYWLHLKQAGRNTVQKVVADCPLTVYVTNADGLRSGIAQDGIYTELTDVLFNVHPLEDGTIYSELIYPKEAGYQLILEASGDGQAYVLVQDLEDFSVSGENVAVYDLAVSEGELYESMLPKAELIWEAGSIQPEFVPLGEEPAWLDELPGLAAVGEEGAQKGSQPDWLPNWRILFIAGFALLLLGLAGFAILAVLIIPEFVSRKRDNQSIGQQKRNSRWILAVVVVVITCLLVTCGGLSLYLGITGR